MYNGRSLAPTFIHLFEQQDLNHYGKTYQPHAIEKAWYTQWEERGYFAPQGKGDAYCIMIPPPNVTGSLHMGHAFRTPLWTR